MRRRARWIAVVAAVVMLGGGGTAYGLTRGSSHTYRTAVVARGSVVQTIEATGTVSPVSAAEARFQVAGTVSKVLVKTGEHVRAGQVLARLDRSSLRDQLKSAQSSLTAARSRMAADVSGQSAAADHQAALQSSHPTVSPSAPAASPKGSLAKDQAAVRDAQRATDADLAAAHDALLSAQSACASSDGPSAPESSPPASPTDSSTAAAQPSPASTDTGQTCTTASAALLAAQQQVDRDETALATAEATLSSDLASLAAAVGGADDSSSSRSSHAGSNKPSASSAAGAAQIALDQASVDQATAQVAVAKADLAQATLRSTIDGRVAALTIADGDRVSVSSSDGIVKVLGSRQEQVTLALSAEQVRRVRIGMPARIVPDGTTRPLAGRVVAINSAGSTSQSGTTSYPVTVSLPVGKIVSGAAAAVTLMVSSVAGVLAVPTSAVHHAGTRAYADVLSGGKMGRRTITIGAVGTALTQVTGGLSAGQRVVLADLDQAVPSSSSNLTGGGGLFGRGGRAGQRFARQFVTSPNGAGSVTVGGPAG